jgi:hypothetical protein
MPANTQHFSYPYPYSEMNSMAALTIRILIANSCIRDGGESLKSSHRMGKRGLYLKISSPLSFINTYQMNLISAGSN